MSADPLLCHLERVRQALRSGELSARKSLGQHFLLQADLLRRMVGRAEVVEGRRVIEIGPGPGGLTAALLEAGARVRAYELDSRWVSFLERTLAGEPRLEVRSMDVRQNRGQAFAAEVRELADEDGRAPLVVSNLPYSVASPILVDLVALPRPPEQVVVMVQDEVANRIVAPPGSSQRGLLTLLIGLAARTKKCYRVPPGSFTPPPRVSSAVVEILPECEAAAALAADPWLRPLLRVAFRERRKMLRSSLGRLIPGPTLQGFDDRLLQKRPQQLTEEEWRGLARGLGDVPPPEVS